MVVTHSAAPAAAIPMQMNASTHERAKANKCLFLLRNMVIDPGPSVRVVEMARIGRFLQVVARRRG